MTNTRPPDELHGCSLKTSLKDAAKHEAGHALALWLLDCYLGGVCLLASIPPTSRPRRDGDG